MRKFSNFVKCIFVALAACIIVTAAGGVIFTASETDGGTSEVTLLASGDNMIHRTLLDICFRHGRYDFDTLYSHVDDDIRKADIATANQESVFVPSDYDYGYRGGDRLLRNSKTDSGKPVFATPTAQGDAIVNAGFDVVTLANNHMMDDDYFGLYYTRMWWDSQHPEITTVGSHVESDEPRVKVIEKNNIRIAVISCTAFLNYLPSDKNYADFWQVDLMKDCTREKLASDLSWAEKNADFTIVYPHWGTEYTHRVSASQKAWASWFADHGADLIIGMHPHVLQPHGYVTGSTGKKAYCYYSLGNFASGLRRRYSLLGGMATVTIRKTPSGCTLTSHDLTPTVMQFDSRRRHAAVYKLSDYTSTLAAHQDRDRFGNKPTLKYLKKEYREAMQGTGSHAN